MNNEQGWLNVYKPRGISSFNVVYKIKKKFNLKKIGHGGTLDPLAEGVLPIAIREEVSMSMFPGSNKPLTVITFPVMFAFITFTNYIR